MMSGTYLLLQIAGSASLMLWGIRMARTAVMRAHGPQIRRHLPNTLKHKFLALFTGLGAAAVLQSSTAVAVFLASLASMGVVPVAGGLAVMMGAYIGSAAMAALLTLNLKGAWPVLIITGYVVHAIYERSSSKAKQHGRFLLGLGVVLISLTFMSQVANQLAGNNVLRIIVGSLSGEPIIAILVLTILTWLAQSTVSILLLLASLADAGLIADSTLLVAAMLGVNLGGCLPAIVLTWGQAIAARRIVIGTGLFRVVGVVVGLLCIDPMGNLFDVLPGSSGFKVVCLHLLFNTALAIFFTGFVGSFATLLERMLPAPPPAPGEEVFGPRYIPPISGAFQAALPLSALTREILRMADVVQSMLNKTEEVLRTPKVQPTRVSDIRRLDDKVDTLYKAIRGYAVDLTRSDLPEVELKRVNVLLRYALNLENFGDIIDKSLLDITAQKNKRNRCFSDDGIIELGRLFSYISGSMQMSAEVIMGWKAEMASALIHRKREFKYLAKESSERHIERLRRGVSSSLETSSYHLDIVNDLQRLNSLITGIAYDVLSTQDEAAEEPREEVAEEKAWIADTEKEEPCESAN